MIWLVLGVVLWNAAHLFKRVAPDMRASMGEAGKGVVAVLVLGAIVLMVLGYRAAEVTPLWFLGTWAISANNTLMLASVALLGVGQSKSRLRSKMRHPMLTGLVVWAVAHLLVNGELRSLVLFGGLGLWALVSMMVINRSEPAPEPFVDGTAQGDTKLAVITVVTFAVIALAHIWLGPWPFPALS